MVGAGVQGETGIMVAKIRARQSATSLLGAQAKAGVYPIIATVHQCYIFCPNQTSET